MVMLSATHDQAVYSDKAESTSKSTAPLSLGMSFKKIIPSTNLLGQQLLKREL